MLFFWYDVTGKDPYKDTEGLHSFWGDLSVERCLEIPLKSCKKPLGFSMGSFIWTSLTVRLSKVVGDHDDLLTQSRGISFHAVVVFGVGKNLLSKSVLGHCVWVNSGKLFFWCELLQTRYFWSSAVDFLCLKLSESFYFFSLKNIILGAHFLLLKFWKSFNFWSTLFFKNEPNFLSAQK